MNRLDHVHLFASDVEATVDFYREMFGARVVFDATLAGSRNVRLDLGGGAIHLYAQPPRSADRGLVHHLGIRTDDLEALVTHMRARGVAFRKAITEDPAFRYVMVEAPDRVLLELYEVKPAAGWMLEGGDA